MHSMFDIRKCQEEVLFENVKKASNETMAGCIVYGGAQEAKALDDPAWVKASMKKLEESFSEKEVKEIRMGCQCGYGIEEKIALVEELMKEATSLETFGNSEKAHSAGLFYDEGTLFLQFLFCPCPMLAKVERLESLAWCQCTAGYSKALFEKAFGCKIDVELLESIKAGHKRCLMKIMPEKDIFIEIN